MFLFVLTEPAKLRVRVSKIARDAADIAFPISKLLLRELLGKPLQLVHVLLSIRLLGSEKAFVYVYCIRMVNIRLIFCRKAESIRVHLREWYCF